MARVKVGNGVRLPPLMNWLDMLWHEARLAEDADYISWRHENAVAMMSAVDRLPPRLRQQVYDLGPEAHEANPRIERMLGLEPEPAPMFPYMARI